MGSPFSCPPLPFTPPTGSVEKKDENPVLKSKFLIMFLFELCKTDSKIKLGK